VAIQTLDGRDSLAMTTKTHQMPLALSWSSRRLKTRRALPS
jgi:hypothetical protein